MRNVLLTVALLFLVTDNSTAQQKSKMGLGMSIGTTTFYASANMTPKRLVFTSIYLPIHVSDNFKIEPELGFTDYSASYSSYGESGKQSNSGLKLGIGLFKKKPIEQTQVYYGIRLGIIQEKEKYSYSGYYSESDNTTHKYIGPAFGAEHFFSPAFSFGGETQIIYTVYDTGESDVDFTSLDNTVHLFLRWYWN